MSIAKGAVLALLSRAYLTRDRVALIGFGGETATIVLPPTRSVSRARDRLRTLATSGATPLADALSKARQLICSERRRNPALLAQLLLLSDGEANVPMRMGETVEVELARVARQIRQSAIPCELFDTNPSGKSSEPLRSLAALLGARWHDAQTLGLQVVLDCVASSDANR